MYYPIETQAALAQLLACVEVLGVQVDTRLTSAENQYKRDHDKPVKRTPVFAQEQLLYVAKPPLTAFSVIEVDKMATTTYNKLIAKTVGSFSITKVSGHTLVVDRKTAYTTRYPF